MENESTGVATVAAKPPQPGAHIKKFMESDSIKDRFRQMLGERAAGFITSILQIVTANETLAAANPMTIYGAAATAAAMDLPVNQNLGFAWIVPYAGQAQFQMGYKGFIQLALRTAQYKRLNVVLVYENQFKSWNALTEDLEADFSVDGVGNVVGVCSYFKLTNGFEKVVYWSREKITNHAKKYSKSYHVKSGQWMNNWDDMALKTVLKNALSKWGILSIEMQMAMKVDQAVVKDPEAQDIQYIDNVETAEDRSDKATDATLAAIKKEAEKTAGKK